LGWKWDDGTIGGSLKHAIDSDSADIAEEPVMGGSPAVGLNGVSIQNLITGHERYGETDVWY
jgi:hypothetical protein